MPSPKHFSRWQHVQEHSWPFQVFKQYYEEINSYLWADYAVRDFTMKGLKSRGYTAADPVSAHFSFPRKVWTFQKVGDWKNAYDDLQNHLYLDCVMSLSSVFETFLDAIVSLAIESDPGVLLNSPRKIDGATLLVNGGLSRNVYKNHIEKITNGTWKNRKKNFRILFNAVPPKLNAATNALDRMRLLRNKVGHAFGRDIEAARDFRQIGKIPAEQITLRTLKNYLKIVYDVAEELDAFMLDNHIGEYQAILAYHTNKQQWEKLNRLERHHYFRKLYGRTDQKVGTLFCKELIEYYDHL